MKYMFSFQAKVFLNLLLTAMSFFSPSCWWQMILGICMCKVLLWIASYFGLKEDMPFVYMTCFALAAAEYCYIFFWLAAYKHADKYACDIVETSLIYACVYLVYHEHNPL